MVKQKKTMLKENVDRGGREEVENLKMNSQKQMADCNDTAWAATPRN